MKIAISGANGYIAKNLILELQAGHYSIVPIQRQSLYDVSQLTELLTGCDAVVNLAGAPILQRWTVKNKKEILRSRITATRNIVQAINNLPEDKRPATFLSASAIGIYSVNNVHTEKSNLFSTDFVGEVVKKWEEASLDLAPNVRRVIFRISPILGKQAQMIQKLLPVFKMGLGGKIGSGTQAFPFVHIFDVVNALVWGIENERTSGTYNLTAPENINNKTFTNTLAHYLHRPAIFTVPGFALKLSYGEAASILLKSPQVKPERLINEGFVFLFPDIKSCITEILT